MPSFNKRNGRWVIRFKDRDKMPNETSESLPIDTPKNEVKRIEGEMNAAYYSDWDPWALTWKEYNYRKQLKESGVIDSGITLEEAVQVYVKKLIVRGRITSDVSEYNLERTLTRFIEFVGERKMLSNLTPRHAENYLRSLNIKKTTMGEYASKISLFYDYWRNKKMIHETFEYYNKANRQPREEKIKYLTLAEKNKMVKYIQENREQVTEHYMHTSFVDWMQIDDLIEVFFYQGFRFSEVFDNLILKKHVDLARGTIEVTGKGNKTRTVKITPPLRDLGIIQRAYNKAIDNLFPCSGPSFRKLLKEVAIKALGKEYKWVSPHNLRHSCGTYWAGEFIPVEVIQKQLGHTNINTTMVYVRVTDKSTDKAFQRWEQDGTPITKLNSTG